MRDSSHHGGKPADPDPPGELAGRLLRRARGGVGVIDKGWAQRRFAYTTDWVAQRFAVLGLMNARYGTVDHQAAGTSTSLPIVHGSFARKRFGTSPNESSTHATGNDSSPGTLTNEASPRLPNGETSPHTTINEAPPRTDNEESPRMNDEEASPRMADDRTLASGGEPRAAEIPAPSSKTGDALIIPVVQRKSATLSPDAALLRAESQRPAPQKSQPSPTQESQPSPAQKSQTPSVLESASRAGSARPSPDEPPGATAAEGSAHQPSASDAVPDNVKTKQGLEVQETVPRPHATHERTLRIDAHEPTLLVEARAEAPTTIAAADATVVGESGELNPLPPSLAETNPLPPNPASSPEQQRGQLSQTASPLPLRETALIVSRVAQEASDSSANDSLANDSLADDSSAKDVTDSLTKRDETFERGGHESESPVSGAGDPQGGQSRTNSLLPVAAEQTATAHHTQLAAPLQQRRSEPAQTATLHHPHHDQRTLQAEIAPPKTRTELASPKTQADVSSPKTTTAAPLMAQAEAVPPRHPPVSALEVPQRALQLSGARMIWRKGFGVATLAADDAWHSGQTGVPQPRSVQSVSSWSTPHRAEAIAADGSRTAEPGDGGSFAPAAPAQSEAGGGIDLEQITEHVSRVILRRVSVERERRGIGRWL
jgi:hypothetical protein